MSRCPICGGSETSFFFELKDSPLLQNVLYETHAGATAAERVDVDFLYCRSCHFVFNPHFQEARVRYSAAYNNNQLASHQYRQYIDALAHQLIAECELTSDSRILEIGCGSGYFLSRLRAILKNDHVRGYDPAYDGQHGMGRHIAATCYVPGKDDRFDLVILRHCLESLIDYDGVIGTLHAAMDAGSRLYIEATNLDFIIGQHDVTLLNHEYARYFSLRALQCLMASYSLELIEARRQFGNHYLGCLFGKAVAMPVLAAPFAQLEARAASYERVVIWGIAGRAISFMAQTPWARRKVSYGVDLDETKQGKFIPVGGQKILAPGEAKSYKPQLVIVSNENYLNEIRDSFGSDCDYITLKGKFYGRN